MVLTPGEGGGGGTMPEWCATHPELCSAQPPQPTQPSQPSQPQPSQQCGPEYRQKPYSNPADAVRVTITLKNAVYGAKPATARVCIGSQNRFVLNSVQLYVYEDGNRIYAENIGTISAGGVCRTINIPPPPITASYVQRRVKFRVYVTVGEGLRTVVGTKTCGGATYNIYEVPVWKGQNPIVIERTETITWYATPGEAQVKVTPSGKPAATQIAFRASVNPLQVTLPFKVVKGLSYYNAKLNVSISPAPISNEYALDVEIPGARIGTHNGRTCIFYGPLRIYKYGCRRLGYFQCLIEVAPQQPGTYKLPLKICIVKQTYNSKTKQTAYTPVKCETVTATLTWVAQKPAQPQPKQPSQPVYTTTTQPTQPAQPSQPVQPTTQPTQPTTQPSQPQPTQPLWNVPPPTYQPPSPTPPAPPTQPYQPYPEWCADHPELCYAQPPSQPSQPQPPTTPPEELAPTPPPQPPSPITPPEQAAQQAPTPPPSPVSMALKGALLVFLAGSALFAVSSIAHAATKSRSEELKARIHEKLSRVGT